MNKSESEQKFPLEPVQISLAGTYFRSEGLSHAEFGKDYITWHEAVEHPLTNMWQVSEVTQRPDTLTGSGETIIEVTPVKECLSIPLRLALEHVATFEHAQKRMGFEAAVNHKAEDLGDEHIKTFAGLNGFVLDIYNKPHVAQEGRPVTKGFFNPTTVHKARADYLRKPEEKPKVSRTDLSHLFRDASKGCDNFERLLDRRIDVNKWSEFMESAIYVVRKLGVCQNESYKPVNKNVALGLFTEEGVYGEADFRKAMKDAGLALNKCTFLPSNERNTMLKSFLDMAELAFHVGHAKTVFKAMEQSDSPEKHKQKIKITTDKAIKFARSIGGSDQDAKRINATIIEIESAKSLEDLITGYFSSDKKMRERHGTAYRYSSDRYGGSYDPDVIFMPKDIFDLMNDFHDLGDRMKEAIKVEKQRIQSPIQSTEASPPLDTPEV